MLKPRIVKTKSNAEVWFYWSKSGRSMEFYVCPLDGDGNAVLPKPVRFRLTLKRLQKGTRS